MRESMLAASPNWRAACARMFRATYGRSPLITRTFHPTYGLMRRLVSIKYHPGDRVSTNPDDYYDNQTRGAI